MGGSGYTRYMHSFSGAFTQKIPFAGSYFDVFYHDATAATLKALAAVHGDLSGGETAVHGRSRRRPPCIADRVDQARQGSPSDRLQLHLRR